MHRVLVTGGAGYIGSHACKAIASAGFEPVTFDNLSTGHRSFCRWGPLVPGDIRDPDGLDRAFRAFAPVAVMHFAAQSIVSQSVARPAGTFETNVAGTLNLLAAMARHGVSRLVFSSTCAVYGTPARVPIDEDCPVAPISPYGASKAMAERIIADVAAATDLSHVALRYFNAAGADRDGAIGEWHEPETHLIPCVLGAALGEIAAVPINGTDFDTPDGTAVRDFIHVSDLAAAHVAALRHLLAGRESAVLNVGTGRGTSVAEIVAAVAAASGRAVPTAPAPRRPGDAACLVANPRKANSLLQWKAECTLSDIIEDALRWHSGLSKAKILVA